MLVLATASIDRADQVVRTRSGYPIPVSVVSVPELFRERIAPALYDLISRDKVV